MEFQNYVKHLRKWWWLLVLATTLAAASSSYAVSQQPKRYQARTTLMLGSTFEDPNPTGNELSLGQQLAALYADIANRQIVRENTMKALGLNRLPSYQARTLPDSQLIEIIVTDTSPERALLVANELANQLILQSPTAPQPEEQERAEFINEQLTGLQEEIEETEAEIAALEEQLESAFSAREIEQLKQQTLALQDKLNTLQSNYAALYSKTQGGAINALTVIEPASLPTRPVNSGGIMTVLTASLIGFVMAAGAVYVLAYLDDTIKTSEDVKYYTDLPVLPGIADFAADDEEPKLITRTEPLSPIAEAFRALRTAIKASDRETCTVQITSAKPNEGKSVTAGNLSVVMAQAGHRVLLIDADLRRSLQHKLFGLPRNRGLTDVLMVLHLDGRIDNLQGLLDDVIQETPEPGLHLLSSGNQVPNAYTLLGSDAIPALLGVLRQHYDYVILDSPPVLAVTDALMLSTQVDSVILIGDAGRLRRKELKQTVERLRDVKAHILGLSLNRLNPKTENYYTPYYEYYSREQREVEKKGNVQDRSENHEWLRRWTHRVATDDDVL